MLYAVRKVLGHDDIVISDVGTHKMWVAKFYPVYGNNTLLISNGFASMGFALPAAIGAKLTYPHKKVVAVCGDGGFLMNVQELETACRLGLNVVIVIFNDGGYDLIKWKSACKFGSCQGLDFTNPDFVKLAESFGAQGLFRHELGRPGAGPHRGLVQEGTRGRGRAYRLLEQRILKDPPVRVGGPAI